jgi:hypothetical protein
MLAGRAKTRLGIRDGLESEYLLPHEDEIVVREHKGGLGALSAWRIFRVPRGEANVNAVGARQVAQKEPPFVPDEARVTRGNVEIVGENDIALETPKVELRTEWIALTIRSRLRDDDESPSYA